MTAPRHTNELKIPEKVLTLCSKSGPIEKRLVRSMIRQVIREIPVRMRNFQSAGVLLILSIFIGLLLCELILRQFFPQPLYKWQQGLFEPDRLIGYKLVKNYTGLHTQPDYSYKIHTNSFGFRGREPRPEARDKVLVLGDSFAFGQGVPEARTFSNIVRDHFSAKNIDFDLFNTAVSGYSLINEKQVLIKFLPLYKPALVLVFFYWNDLGASESMVVENGYLRFESAFKLGNVRTYLSRNSHLFTLAKKFYYASKTPLVRACAGATEEDMRWTGGQLLEMKRMSEAFESIFRLFIIPCKGIGVRNPSWMQSKQKFLRLLSSMNIPYVDLESALVGLSEGQRQGLVFPNDDHWNQKGHEFFSKHIIQEIESLLYLEPTVKAIE